FVQPCPKPLNRLDYPTLRMGSDRAFDATSSNGVHPKRIVIEKPCHGVIARCFHFDIWKAKYFFPNPATIRAHISKHVVVTYRNAHGSALGRKKSWRSNGVAWYHSNSDTISERRRTLHNVRPQRKL